jgi:hypothetical protein
MIIGIGQWIANKWLPSGVDLEQWANFIDISLLLMLVVVVVIFIWYTSSYHRSRKIYHPDDIFLQRKPWVNTLWCVFIIHGALAIIFGLFLISEKSPPSIVAIIIFAALEGGFGVLLYWFISLIFHLPARAKYVPYLKYRGR